MTAGPHWLATAGEGGGDEKRDPAVSDSGAAQAGERGLAAAWAGRPCGPRRRELLRGLKRLAGPAVWATALLGCSAGKAGLRPAAVAGLARGDGLN
jgi:hypothetical protein